MRRFPVIPILVVAFLFSCLFPLGGNLQAQRRPEIGDVPPEISARKWFHWVGDGPKLESLKGRAVMVHFFVTKEPKKAQWLTLLKFYNDHKDKGLLILAVTRDGAGSVEQMLRDFPLPFPVGAGSEMQSTWVASGNYGQVILDRNGEIFYRTDAANGTWNGKLLKAMRGAERPKEEAYLQFFPVEEYGKGMKRAIGFLAEGKLAKSLALLEGIIAKETTDDEARTEARNLLSEIDDHVELLMEQIEDNLHRREVLLARAALETLAKELKKHVLGEPARERLVQLEEDEEYAEELEAAEQYDRLVELFFRRGWSKNLARFEKLLEDFPDTRAAEKMENYWIRKLW